MLKWHKDTKRETNRTSDRNLSQVKVVGSLTENHVILVAGLEYAFLRAK